MEFNEKTIRQLWEHVLAKRDAHRLRPLTEKEQKDCWLCFLSGVIVAKGMARDSKTLFREEFLDELTGKIEAQIEVERVLS